MGAIPGMKHVATWMMNNEIEKLDFPPVAEFVEMVADAGTCLYGCKMSMDMMGLTEDDLVEPATVLGAIEFLEIADGAQVMFV
jgi:predicted peroxiredoxin